MKRYHDLLNILFVYEVICIRTFHVPIQHVQTLQVILDMSAL